MNILNHVRDQYKIYNKRIRMKRAIYCVRVISLENGNASFFYNDRANLAFANYVP